MFMLQTSVLVAWRDAKESPGKDSLEPSGSMLCQSYLPPEGTSGGGAL